MGAILTGSIIYIVLGIIAALGIGQYVYMRTKDESEGGKYKSDNRVLTYGLVGLATFCLWIVWVCCYMHQMYPLINPELELPEHHE